jgi:hypothetical protein
MTVWVAITDSPVHMCEWGGGDWEGVVLEEELSLLTYTDTLGFVLLRFFREFHLFIINR